MDGIHYINKEVDLIHSPDDGGYYFTDYTTDKTSIVYSTYDKAMAAWDNTDGLFGWGES